jgi:hypothetical protein
MAKKGRRSKKGDDEVEDPSWTGGNETLSEEHTIEAGSMTSFSVVDDDFATGM